MSYMSYEKHDFDLALVRFFDAMRADYSKAGFKATDFDLAVDPVKKGQKFVRIWKKSYGQRSAHSFIVLKDCVVNIPTKRGAKLSLKVGDILKCASWKVPALNFIRGNILDVNYGACAWTGAG
jgi:hypothetical protein